MKHLRVIGEPKQGDERLRGEGAALGLGLLGPCEELRSALQSSLKKTKVLEAELFEAKQSAKQEELHSDLAFARAEASEEVAAQLAQELAEAPSLRHT